MLIPVLNILGVNLLSAYLLNTTSFKMVTKVMLVARPLFFYTSLAYVLLASNFSLVSPSLSNSPAFMWITSLVNHVAAFSLLQVVVGAQCGYGR